jgi:hypothetical protein
MKKILLPILMLLAMVGTSKAQGNALTVADIDLPQNYEATLTVNFQFDAADTYTGYQFNLQLPDDLEFVMEEGTDVAFIAGSCHAKDHGVAANLNNGMVKVACLSQTSKTFVGTSGTLLTFTIKPKSTLTVGKTYTGSIKDIILVPVQGAKKVLSDGTFTVTIGPAEDFDVLLDENSLVEPSTTDGVKKIKVKRNIKANTWSTICLPFSLSKDEVEAAFGEGTVLAEFYDYAVEEEGTSINVSFNEAEEDEGVYLFSNYPYIIKATNNVESFTINAEIEDVEIEQAASATKNKSRKPIGKFIGTYIAQTIVPENSLFLNSGKFYYSKGNTKMKAFRAYFTFNDVISNSANARINIFAGGESTKIDAHTMEPIESGKVYNMAGQYMGEVEDTNRLPKGVYIVNGKKTVKK